jgi:microcystin-dependent protein
VSDVFVGEIKMVGSNFAPRDWAFCNGQLLSIAQNSALFALIGTTYGGNGQTTFALPNLQSRLPMHAGSGPGLATRSLGEAAGTETTTLTTANMPAHNHSSRLRAEAAAGNTANPTDGMISVSTQGDRVFGPDTTATEVNMNVKAISQQNVGGNAAFNNIQPCRAVNFIIALFGVFPSRN